MHKDDEIFPLSVDMTIEGTEIKKIKSELILPKRLTDQPEIKLYPDNVQQNTMAASVWPVYSIRGKQTGPRGKIIARI